MREEILDALAERSAMNWTPAVDTQQRIKRAAFIEGYKACHAEVIVPMLTKIEELREEVDTANNATEDSLTKIARIQTEFGNREG